MGGATQRMAKICGGNPNGDEPSCKENWHLCGRKIRIRCAGGADGCANGDRSLLAMINNGEYVANNYIPDYYIQATSDKVGKKPRPAKSVVLIITDFCPKNHSRNRQYSQCQKPQLDISTSAFLLLAGKNNQGFIKGLKLASELLPVGDRTSPGPHD